MDMDSTLWSFLINHPDRPVPYPWERIYDYEAELLYYYNNVRGSIVVDLRTRVNLGGGLFHESNATWHELFGRYNTNYHHVWNNFRDEDAPVILPTRCQGRFYTFIIPQVLPDN